MDQLVVSIGAEQYDWQLGSVEHGEPATWHLVFKFTIAPISFRYILHEPYVYSRREWADLTTSDNGHIMCDGGGSIAIEGDQMTFRTESGGVGGDVDVEFTVPRARVAQALGHAIQYAIDKGWPFATD